MDKDTTVLFKKGERYAYMSDGEMLYPVFIGGKIVRQNTQHTIQDINGEFIKVRGKWRSKHDFEPCKVVLIKSKKKCRGRNR